MSTLPMTQPLLRLLVLNGPNLNLLGLRERGIYGQATLAEIEAICRTQLDRLIRAQESAPATLEFFQSNHEGVLVDRIQQARGVVDLIILNPAALTHTSVALRDALLAVEIPVIEVHLSNIYKREPFRHHSYISDIALGHIVGLGAEGYRFAVEAGVRYLSALASTSRTEGRGVTGDTNQGA
ncbi:MAG: type II 3-dehydroquinate dehydratase [Magnetococcus sp. MYC-9]